MPYPVPGERLGNALVAVAEQCVIEGSVDVGCGVDERAVEVEKVSGVVGWRVGWRVSEKVRQKSWTKS
jgi:hypothetical protein